METETQEAPEWARDLVLTELARTGHRTKEELQEATGVGPGDLRATLEGLEQEGRVSPSDTGWSIVEAPEEDGALGDVLGQPTEWPAGDAIAAEQRAAEQASGGSDVEPGDLAALGAQLGSAGPIRVRVVVDVMFIPEEGEQVMELAELMRFAATQGVIDRHPDLQTSGTLESVDVFDAPRRLYPA